MSECHEDLLKEALELLREALASYLASNCRKITSLARLAGQSKVRIELYGLFRYFSPSENFPRFMNALSYVKRCATLDDLRRALEFEDLEIDERDERLSRLVYRLSVLERLCSEAT
ncbi:MAG: hypothetical protein GXO32_05540 [Crenarchaeota archaeon]|nr:hypothetical protein [Thermoproteota archaeon]